MNDLQIRHRSRATIYYILLGIGILLALLLIFAGEMKDGSTVPTLATTESSQIASEERKVKYLLEEMEGVKDVSVMLRTSDDGEISGIAIVCKDGENALLQEKIIRLLRALYGIGSHQISVSG